MRPGHSVVNVNRGKCETIVAVGPERHRSIHAPVKEQPSPADQPAISQCHTQGPTIPVARSSSYVSVNHPCGIQEASEARGSIPLARGLRSPAGERTTGPEPEERPPKTTAPSSMVKIDRHEPMLLVAQLRHQSPLPPWTRRHGAYLTSRHLKARSRPESPPYSDKRGARRIGRADARGHTRNLTTTLGHHDQRR